MTAAIFSKTAVDVIDHPRMLEAGPVARDLWQWANLYARKHLTDGELPRAAVLSSPWGAGGKANARVAARLVEVGLWDVTETGWRQLRYADHNQTRDDVDADRAGARARQQKSRGAKKAAGNAGSRPVGHAAVTPSVTRDRSPPSRVTEASVTPAESESEEEREEITPQPPLGGREGVRGDPPSEPGQPPARPFEPGTAAAFEAGLRFGAAARKALGRAYSLERGGRQVSALCAALNAHAPPGDVAAALAWLDGSVAAWVASADPQYASGWSPLGWARWLNAGGPALKRAAPTPVQAVDPERSPWLDSARQQIADGGS